MKRVSTLSQRQTSSAALGNRRRVVALLGAMKQRQFGDVKLRGSHAGEEFQLVPLTADCADDARLMDLLGRWRESAETWFQAIFPVTLEGTTRWVRHSVVNESDRVLFLVDVEGKHFGHVGLYRFDFESMHCEIDNIVRGVPGHPGLFESAIDVMMAWGRATLGLVGYTLQTTSDNRRALSLYARLGFEETRRQPLIQLTNGDRSEWVSAPVDYDGAITRYAVYMKLA
jgi:GNAT acetyltransferase-like protein